MSSQLVSSTPNHSGSAPLGSCPLVFSNMIQEWPAAHWTPYHLGFFAGDTKLDCRLHCRYCFQKAGSIQWESACHHVMLSVPEFLNWAVGGTNNCDGDETPCLASYDPKIYWCYLDYKNLDNVVEEKALINQAINWSCFGLDENESFQNYVWLGSQGAHTPCHYDTYGFNLVVQVYGSKRWILFPPEDTENLYATRIPYEESSVYSDVNIKNPDFDKHPKFKNSQPHEIILKAGQVLYVPRKWWHFAECLETSLSINTWLQVPEDNVSGVEEAITRMILSKWITSTDGSSDRWLNPNEYVETDEINAGYLTRTLYSLSPLSKTTKDSDTESSKPTDGASESFESSEEAASLFDSRLNHLEDFLTRVEQILEKCPLQVTGLKSSCPTAGSSASNSEPTGGDQSKRPHHPLPKSDVDKDHSVERPSDDSNIKKRRRLTNLSEEGTSSTDNHPLVQQLSPCPVNKLWQQHLGRRSDDQCPFHPRRESSPEERPHPGPLPGEFVEEELLKNLLKPDIVALLAQRLQKQYTQELDEHCKNK